ncbi:DUF4153 domain-containing protein [Dactylosporangium sp. CS-033363]|uniref:DUF4153 domain-containing protein n=1 Tax=Dactylosporangium sp. CS-033363 TaxID=3239935 RepID=UPI003D8F4561
MFRLGPPPPTLWQRAWPVRSEAASSPALYGALVAAIVAAVALPPDRPGIGWPIAGLGVLVPLAVLLVRRQPAKATTARAESLLWCVAALALLSVGFFRAAEWLFTLSALTAFGCVALAVGLHRRIPAVLVAPFNLVFAAFRAIPWSAAGLTRPARTAPASIPPGSAAGLTRTASTTPASGTPAPSNAPDPSRRAGPAAVQPGGTEATVRAALPDASRAAGPAAARPGGTEATVRAALPDASRAAGPAAVQPGGTEATVRAALPDASRAAGLAAVRPGDTGAAAPAASPSASRGAGPAAVRPGDTVATTRAASSGSTTASSGEHAATRSGGTVGGQADGPAVGGRSSAIVGGQANAVVGSQADGPVVGGRASAVVGSQADGPAVGSQASAAVGGRASAVVGSQAASAAEVDGQGNKGLRLLASIAIGIALLLTFGALFASADAGFARVVDAIIPSVDAEAVARWAFVGLAAAGLSLGAAFLVANPSAVGEGAPRARAVRRVEWLVPVGAVLAIFLLFVAVQLTVLFGDRDYVMRTVGLTFAEYARKGFWQLLVITLLTLGVIAVSARKAPQEDRNLLRVVLGLLATCALVVVGSALWRMNVYEQAYGFTRLRVFVSTVELWLGSLFVLVMIAGATQKRGWLGRAAVALWVVTLLSLAAINPDRLIAAHNVARADQSNADIWYLRTLSADAAEELDKLPPGARECALGGRTEQEDQDDWRGWNLARDRARQIVPEPIAPGEYPCYRRY